MIDVIRKATEEDLSAIMDLLEKGRRRMRQEGNMEQWPTGNPSKEMVHEDIAKGRSYLAIEEGHIVGTFCLLETPEPNYAQILGAWRNDEAYLTLHRVAADPVVHGLARAMFAFAEKRAREQGIYNLRIDTHKMNQGMQRVIRKAGFVHCGVIHLADGAPREAFQKIVKNEPRETEK